MWYAARSTGAVFPAKVVETMYDRHCLLVQLYDTSGSSLAHKEVAFSDAAVRLSQRHCLLQHEQRLVEPLQTVELWVGCSVWYRPRSLGMPEYPGVVLDIDYIRRCLIIELQGVAAQAREVPFEEVWQRVHFRIEDQAELVPLLEPLVAAPAPAPAPQAPLRAPSPTPPPVPRWPLPPPSAGVPQSVREEPQVQTARRRAERGSPVAVSRELMADALRELSAAMSGSAPPQPVVQLDVQPQEPRRTVDLVSCLESVRSCISCPITQALLVDARMCPQCGNSFSKQSIEEWLARRTSCPLCRAPLVSSQLLPNLQLQQVAEGLRAVLED